MIVVLYAPVEGDPTSGPITECIEAPQGVIDAVGRPYREVDERRDDWDFTHEVAGGEVVARDPAILEALQLTSARRRLRARRDVLLRETFDPVRMNPMRWDALSADQQAAMLAYRLALLDWPESEADPLAPTPPELPEI